MFRFSTPFAVASFFIASVGNAQASGAQNTLASFLPFVLILGVMYFLVIRPQNKKAKTHREMVSALKKGDDVIVVNGIIGKVSKVIDNNEILVEISKDTEIKVVRSSVSQVLTTAKTVTTEKKSPLKKSSVKKKINPKKTTATRK